MLIFTIKSREQLLPQEEEEIMMIMTIVTTDPKLREMVGKNSKLELTSTRSRFQFQELYHLPSIANSVRSLTTSKPL
jgi:hypothetical protein